MNLFTNFRCPAVVAQSALSLLNCSGVLIRSARTLRLAQP